MEMVIDEQGFYETLAMSSRMKVGQRWYNKNNPKDQVTLLELSATRCIYRHDFSEHIIADKPKMEFPFLYSLLEHQ